MKTMRKVLAVLMAMALAVMTSLYAIADTTTPTIPLPTDTGKVTITGVEAGATVTAYQITKGEYNDKGFNRFVSVTKADPNAPANADPMPQVPLLADIFKPTAAEVNAIANDATLLASLTHDTLTYSAATASGVTPVLPERYTKDLQVGTWLIVVTGTVKDVYNPMIVSVYYSGDKDADGNYEMIAGSVDASQNWVVNNVTAHAKKSTIDIEKTIVSPSSGNGHGDDHARGDNIRFHVGTQIPSYSDEYKTESLTFVFHDKVSAGLEFLPEGTDVTANLNLVVKDKNESTVAASNYTVSLSNAKDELTVTFEPEFIKANAGNISLEYNAKMKDTAALGFTGENNEVYVTYTNSPEKDSDGKHKTNDTPHDITHHYTFAIDGSIYADMTKVKTPGEEGSRQTITKGHELIKINDKGDVAKVNETETASEVTYWKTEGTPEISTETVTLEGAVFQLKNNVTEKTYTATTTKDGHMLFEGLDAGTYTLKEIQAPAGYSLDEREVPVVISTTYNTDGTLASYSVTVDNQPTATYTAHYGTKTDIDSSVEYKTTPTEITVIDAGSTGNVLNPYLFKNTKLGALPSTGGVGTVLFSIIGSLGMIAGVAILFINRRRVQK